MKKYLPYIIGIIIILIIIIIIVLNLFNVKNKRENYISELAKNFYEDYYYPQVGGNDEERISYVKNYTSIGFNMTLKGLLVYTNDNKIKEFFDGCDKENSKVTIYPKSPYKKSDYKLLINLKCD